MNSSSHCIIVETVAGLNSKPSVLLISVPAGFLHVEFQIARTLTLPCEGMLRLNVYFQTLPPITYEVSSQPLKSGPPFPSLD